MLFNFLVFKKEADRGFIHFERVKVPLRKKLPRDVNAEKQAIKNILASRLILNTMNRKS